MMRKRSFWDKNDFTKDSDDIQIIQPRYIEQIDLGLQLKQTGTTSPSLEDMLSILDRVQVKLTGKIVTELKGRDVLAYNCLVENRSIKYTVPAGDTQYGYVEGLSLPLKLAPGAHILSVRFLYNSVSTITDTKLSFSTLESDTVLSRAMIQMPRYVFTPPSTGAFNTALDSTFSGTLIGFLVYSTTIPTTSATTTTVSKLRVKIGGDIAYEDNWQGLCSQTFYPEDSTLRSVLDNYVFLDFRKDPVPAGSRIEVQVYSDDTNDVIIIPVVQV
ncbi:MAG: hypothetical protein DRN92_03140 [Thermoproteota archaeon]|nr:MAG: hypothetical protein DRN92_03140 [Candidatus Korarchaeota archaeon]